MALGVLQVVGREALGGDVAEDDARVGGQCRHGFAVGVVETEVALPVFGRQSAVHAQQAGQFVGRQSGHAGRQLAGLAEEAGLGGAGRRKGALVGHRFGAGEEYLHGVTLFYGIRFAAPHGHLGRRGGVSSGCVAALRRLRLSAACVAGCCRGCPGAMLSGAVRGFRCSPGLPGAAGGCRRGVRPPSRRCRAPRPVRRWRGAPRAGPSRASDRGCRGRASRPSPAAGESRR